MARKPPLWLKAGDSVTIEIEKIGSLTNPVVTGPGMSPALVKRFQLVPPAPCRTRAAGAQTGYSIPASLLMTSA